MGIGVLTSVQVAPEVDCAGEREEDAGAAGYLRNALAFEGYVNEANAILCMYYFFRWCSDNSIDTASGSVPIHNARSDSTSFAARII